MLLSASLRSEVAATDVDIRPDPVDGAKAAADAMAAAKTMDFMVVCVLLFLGLLLKVMTLCTWKITASICVNVEEKIHSTFLQRNL
jgi:hypothetical protein